VVFGIARFARERARAKPAHSYGLRSRPNPREFRLRLERLRLL
jgi:hypothetical protein